MTSWTAEELDSIGQADELLLASRREDGTLRRYVIIWAVREGDDIFARSAFGAENPWYRRAMASGTGRISAGGVERDVDFVPAAPDVQEAIDAVYHAKYDHYGAADVDPVVGPHSYDVTIRLAPR